jgi:hypothetical protein
MDQYGSNPSYDGADAIRIFNGKARLSNRVGGRVNEGANAIHLTDEQRLDWLRLIRSQNVGPRGIMAQTPQAARPKSRVTGEFAT